MLSTAAFSQEICDNGIDDDGDGLIDLNDVVDCYCAPVIIPSLIPNASFEQTDCCPTSFSQLSCATGWSQATDPTSDFFNCGFNFGAASSAGLVPPPDGIGYLGAIFSPGWQEYVGSCLTSPLLAGNPYTLEMSIASTPIDGQGAVCNGGVIDFPPIDITIFGHPGCPAFPVGTSTCPSAADPAWIVVGTATYTPVSNWGIISITFTPTANINAVIIGSPCALPAGYSPPSGCYPYFYFDNLILQESNLSNNITQTGQWCDNNIQLITGPTAGSTYQWYLDGIALTGETNLTLNVSTNNYGVGNYTIVTTTGPSCASSSDSVVLPPLPLASYIAASVCDGLPVSFIDNSSFPSGTITNWNWDFGDGNTSNLQNPSHPYSSSGPYNPVLIVTGDNNCTDTISIPIDVFPNPSTAFTVGNYALNDSTLGIPKGICEFDNVNFTDNSNISNGNIISWDWDFGDGNTSTLQNPSHSYSPSGTFNVQLNVVSDSGCVDSILTPITISPKPVANFSVDDDCFNFPLIVNDLSTVSSGSIAGLQWDFGDGVTSSSFAPSHTYLNDGVFNVNLIAVSDSGCSDTTTQITERYPTPLADFSSLDVCFGDSSCFLNSSSINPSDTISSYIWNFGDGSPLQTLPNICHNYAAPGNYNVTLIAASNHSCLDDTTQQIEVYALPIADFDFTTICENEPPTQFTDLSQSSSGNITTWNWDFGSGNSTNQNPNFTFSSYGTFPVELAITNSVGCVDSIIKNIIVNPKPTAEFDADTTNGCVSLFCVNFQDLSTSNATSLTSWQWDLGNNVSTGQIPSLNCYDIAGNYTVSLIVQNDLGCYDTITKVDYINAYPLPIADFIPDPQPTDIYDPTINFTNISYDASTWIWDFGDGDSSNIMYSPSHIYADSGSYLVQLEVWNQYGCYDSITKWIRIDPVSSIFIPNTFTPDQNGTNEDFFFVGYGILEEDFEFYIFDRWGENIYYTQKFKPWNGTYENKLVPQDVYVYKFVMKDVNNEMHTFVGRVNVLK